MDFTVHTPDGADRYEGATYTVDSAGSGTLHVLTAEGKVVLYGSTGWHRLEVPAPPPPPPPPPPLSASERIEQLRQEAHQEQLEDAERARRSMNVDRPSRPEA